VAQSRENRESAVQLDESAALKPTTRLRALLRDKVATFKEFTDIAGLPEIQRLEERYGVPDDQRASL